MDQVPLISVLMAEYNSEPSLLRAAVRGVLAQSERRFELVIVDDGTGNDLEELARELDDPRIRIVGDGVNRGLAAALNIGLAEARGRYVARTDTDDVLEPAFLEEAYAFLEENPSFVVVSGRALEVSTDARALVLGEPGEITRAAFMRGQTPIHPVTMYRRAEILALGGYPLYRRAEDLALWCEVLLAGGRMQMLDSVLLRYRVEAEDFRKRSLANRGDEIRVRLTYYPRLGAGAREYLRVVKSVVSGVLPVPVVRALRRRLHGDQRKAGLR